MADLSSIDDIVNSGYKGLINNIIEIAKTSLRYTANIIKTGFMLTFNYASYYIGGLAGPVTGAAMVLGRIVVNYKRKIKTRYNDLIKENIKGLILGNLSKFFYKYVVNIISNKTIYGKIARTLTYNLGFTGAIYNPAYLGLTRLLENKTTPKGEWWNLTKRTTAIFTPVHFFTTNYITNVQQQVAASALAGTVYRIIAG